VLATALLAAVLVPATALAEAPEDMPPLPAPSAAPSTLPPTPTTAPPLTDPPPNVGDALPPSTTPSTSSATGAMTPEEWDRRRSRRLSDGLIAFGASYALAAGTGGLMLWAGAKTKDDTVRYQWAAPLFVPVLGPIYVGGRMIGEYTVILAETKGEFAGLAVIFAPFAYAAGIVSIVDGVLQGYGLAMASGLGESPRPGSASGSASASARASGTARVGKGLPKGLWLMPSASERALGMHLGGRF
jgi:hypothetical protein